MAEDATTDDRFLGGRLLLRQPKRGHRAGHDAVVLAASTAASPGQRVVDLGAGIGAAGLAVAVRVPGIDLTLVEIDPLMAALAGHNASVNGIAARVVMADVGSLAPDASLNNVDAVLMNPPFHDTARHRPSPDALRSIAHAASDETLATWLAAARRLLRPRGAVTLIWRADGLAEALAALQPHFGSLEIQSVHASRDRPAIRIVVRAVLDGRAPLILHDGVRLDDESVEAALRSGSGLRLAKAMDKD